MKQNLDYENRLKLLEDLVYDPQWSTQQINNAVHKAAILQPAPNGFGPIMNLEPSDEIKEMLDHVKKEFIEQLKPEFERVAHDCLNEAFQRLWAINNQILDLQKIIDAKVKECSLFP